MAGGAQSDDDDDIISSINVTPLVDIVLVLLIIFMVTTEEIHKGKKPKVIPINLPTAASAQESLSKGLLNLVINNKGTVFLNGEPTDMKGVLLAIERTKELEVRASALISADERTPHGVIVQLMDLLRVNGVRDIAINTEKQEIE